MTIKKALAWAGVPSALAAMGWAQYRKAVKELDRYQPASPVLPGRLSVIPTTFGTISYRMITGDSISPPIVLIHGWGRTGDSAWWPIAWKTDRTVVMVDLPGHGRSRLRERFDLELAANAVIRVIKHAELDRPVLVGHSMGGPIALLVGHKLGDVVSHIGILASSAHWVKPRLAVTLAAAPYLMAPRSPVLIRRQHREATEVPGDAGRVVWEYAARPARSILNATAQALSKFDARNWDVTKLAPVTWVITTDDGVIDPAHQRASAAIFDARVIEVQSEHSIVVDHPEVVAQFLDQLGNAPRHV